MNDDEYNGLFVKFLQDVAEGKIRLSDAAKATHLKLLIDNPAIRANLEARLKQNALDTFDYSPNSEKVEIEKRTFIKMLEKEVKKSQNLEALDNAIVKAKDAFKVSNLCELARNIANNPSEYKTEIFSFLASKVIDLFQK